MDIFVGVFMSIVGGLAAVVVAGAILLLYLKSLFKVIRALQGRSEFSPMTLVRVVGIFIPVLGVLMGFVKGT